MTFNPAAARARCETASSTTPPPEPYHWWEWYSIDVSAALEALKEAQGKVERLRDHHALYCACGTLAAAILGESK